MVVLPCFARSGQSQHRNYNIAFLESAFLGRTHFEQRQEESTRKPQQERLEFISCLWQPFVAFLLVREGRDTLQKVISTERIMIAQADDVSKVHETGFEVG